MRRGHGMSIPCRIVGLLFFFARIPPVTFRPDIADSLQDRL